MLFLRLSASRSASVFLFNSSLTTAFTNSSSVGLLYLATVTIVAAFCSSETNRVSASLSHFANLSSSWLIISSSLRTSGVSHLLATLVSNSSYLCIRRSISAIKLSNLSFDVRAKWLWCGSITALSQLSHRQRRARFGSVNSLSYRSLLIFRQSAHFHASTPTHLSHWRAFISSLITIPQLPQEETNKFCFVLAAGLDWEAPGKGTADGVTEQSCCTFRGSRLFRLW